MYGLSELSLPSDCVSIKSGVLVTFENGNVPDNFLLEVRVVFDLVPRFAEEDVQIEVILVLQHPEQRGIVLDGVGAEDSEPFHALSDSMARSNFKVPEVVEWRSNGAKSGCQDLWFPAINAERQALIM